MYKKVLFIVLMLFVLTVIAVYSLPLQGFINWMTDDGQQFDWYAVTEDEVQRCAMNGGDETAEAGTYFSSGGEGVIPYRTAITVQATKYTTFGNETMYEVAWYIQPIGNDVEYKIELRGKGVEKLKVYGPEVATQVTGAANYWAGTLQAETPGKEYTEAVVVYEDEKQSFPIVKKEENE